MAAKRPINGRLFRHFAVSSPPVRQAFSGVHLLIGSAPLNARNSSLPVGLLAAAEFAHTISILVKAFLLLLLLYSLFAVRV